MLWITPLKTCWSHTNATIGGARSGGLGTAALALDAAPLRDELAKQPREHLLVAPVDVEPHLEVVDLDHGQSPGGDSGTCVRPSCAISSDSIATASWSASMSG